MASIDSLIALAESRVDQAEMRSSAVSCVGEARARLSEGNERAARMWAARSLAYSVGVFHPEYVEARAS